MCECVCVSTCTHVHFCTFVVCVYTHRMCGGQRTTCKNRFSPFTVWGPGTEPWLWGLPGLVSDTFTRGAILPAPSPFLSVLKTVERFKEKYLRGLRCHESVHRMQYAIVLAGFMCQLDTVWSYHRERSFRWENTSMWSSCKAFSQFLVRARLARKNDPAIGSFCTRLLGELDFRGKKTLSPELVLLT